LPLVSYGLIVGVAIWLVLSEASVALMVLALATVLLLISGIWRAWGLVLWIAERRVD
jgi:hypothetical protein